VSAREASSDRQASDRRRASRIAAVCGAILLVLGGAGAVAWQRGWFGRAEDPRVVEIGTLMRDLLEKERQRQGPATFFTAVERMSGIAAVGLKVNALPEVLRPRVMPLAWSVLMDHLDDRMNAYFALRTPAERTTFIDGELAQMDFLKRAFESRGDRPTGASRSPDAARRGAGGSPPSPGGAGQSREQRWTKWVLDHTTPENRARLTEYIAAFERRLAETGRKRL
jgi:hypothetical protein